MGRCHFRPVPAVHNRSRKAGGRSAIAAISPRWLNVTCFEIWEAQMKARSTIWLSLLTIWLACAGSAFAQTDRGNITGTVTDPSGAVGRGAKITATNLDTNEVRQTTTTDEGNFTLTELKAGPWKVNVEAQ